MISILREHKSSWFETPLIANIDDLPYRLTAPLVYHSKRLGLVIVPEGAPTDLASIPFFMRWAFPSGGKYNAAAVVHDELYRRGVVGTRRVSRALADAVLREAMYAKDVRESQRWAIYLGVRLGGWLAWYGHRFRAWRTAR